MCVVGGGAVALWRDGEGKKKEKEKETRKSFCRLVGHAGEA